MPKPYVTCNYTEKVNHRRRFRTYWLGLGLLIIGLLIQSVGLQIPAQAQALSYSVTAPANAGNNGVAPITTPDSPPPAPPVHTRPNLNVKAIPAWQEDALNPDRYNPAAPSNKLQTASVGGPVDLRPQTQAKTTPNSVSSNFILATSQKIYANKTSDDALNHAPPADCYTNPNNTDCSLRSAIEIASADNNRTAALPDLIILQRSTTYNVTTGALPQLPDNVYINTNQNMTCDSSNIIPGINGGGLPDPNIDLLKLGSGDFLMNLDIGNFQHNGVDINGSGNTLTCMLIASGLATVNSGIVINPGASNNQIGNYFGSQAAQVFSFGGSEVVISGVSIGLIIQASNTLSTTNNIVGNTRIGYASSQFSPGNTGLGVYIAGGATNNIIGSTLVTQTNVISQNGGFGVEVAGSGTNGNQIIGNLIGTDPTGNAAVPNGRDGILVVAGASNTVIKNNVISGNLYGGVTINGPSNNTVIQGNTIGVKKDLSGPLYNGTSGPGNNANGTGAIVCNPGMQGNTPDTLSQDCNGIFVYGIPQVGNPTGTLIGGNSNLGQGNLIAAPAGNYYAAIMLDYTSGNTIQGNSIGASLATAKAYNAQYGIYLLDGCSNNQIGGDASLGQGNLIGGFNYEAILIYNFNFANGLSLGSTTNNNRVQGNAIDEDFTGTPQTYLIPTSPSPHYGIDIQGGNYITQTLSNNLVGVDYSVANPNLNTGNLLGNLYEAILLEGFGSSSDNNQINGNKIGVNAAATASLTGNNYGIDVEYHLLNTKIQGNYIGAANLLASSGVGLIFNHSITNTLITQNYIGTNAAGADFHYVLGILALISYKTTISQNIIGMNLTDGIDIDGGNVASVISQNIIRNNGARGINVFTQHYNIPILQNTFSQNSIYGNGQEGINLHYTSMDPNGINGGSDTGINNQPQIPVINTAQIGLNTGLQVTGATSPNSTVEVFLADSTTITQGKTYLGTTAANSAGVYNLNTTLPNGFTLNPPAILVATDTLNDPAFPNRIGSTSQFSNPFTATLAPVLSLNPAALTFQAVVGNNPAGQAVSLAVANGATNYSTSITYNTNNASWLALNPGSGSVTPGNNTALSVNVNTAGLAAGTYTATVTFLDTANAGDKATLNVTLVLTTNTTPTSTPTPTLTPTSTPTPTPMPTSTPTPPGNGNTTYTYNLPLLANNANTTLSRTTTFITFQNLTANATANVNIKYYDINTGNPTNYQDNLNIVGRGQQAILPTIPTGSSFGGVVTSNQPLNLVVSEGLNAGGSAYNVSAATASTLYSPLALNGQFGFNTDIVVFNAASTGLATGKILFYDENGNPSGNTQTFQIAAHASQTFKQADVGSGLGGNHAYWAKIVADNSTATLSAQVIEFGPNNFVATFNALVPAQLSTTVYAPATFNGRFGFVTGMAIANPNPNAATGTIIYYDATGANIGQHALNIPANGVVGIFQGNGGAPANVTSAVISSNQPLIATVNERGGGNVSGTYVGLANGNNNVALPVMANGFAGFITGATVLNTGSTPAHLTFQYLKQDGTAIGTTQSVTLAPNASFLVFQGDAAQGLPGTGSGQPFFGTALLTSDQPVLVTTNALNTGNGLFYTYTEPSN